MGTLFLKKNIVVFLLLTWSNISFCQPIIVDLRDDFTKDKNWVGLAVRNNTISGHAFLILAKENFKKNATEMTVQGFYPNGGVFTAPGQIKDDFISLHAVTSSDQVYFIIDDNDYTTANQLVKTWSAHPPKFNIFTNNCIDLLQSVMQSIGIEPPSRGLFSLKPLGYINKLKEKLSSKTGLSYYKVNERIKLLPEGSYHGILTEGLPSGDGVLVGNNFMYKGTFNKGKRGGKGKLTTEKSEYFGDFENGLPEGIGELTTNSMIFKGQFKGGKFEGAGEIYNKVDKTKKIGTFKDGKMEGKVSVITNNGETITDFTLKDGKRIGPTEVTYKNMGTAILGLGPVKVTYNKTGRAIIQTDENGTPLSSQYTGSDGTIMNTVYNNGMPKTTNVKMVDGREINLERYIDGSLDKAYGTSKGKGFTYKGEFKSLKFDGFGELNIGGAQMRGTFKDGRFEGPNQHIYRDEFTFDGAITFDDNYSYQNGSITFANGDRYQGQLRNYLFHGQGTFIHTETGWNSESFSITERNWQDGKSQTRIINPIPAAAAAFPDPNIFKVPLMDYSIFNSPGPKILPVQTTKVQSNGKDISWEIIFHTPPPVMP